MKKFFIFALAAVSMASCTNDEFLGEGQGQGQNENGAILFSTNVGQKPVKGVKRKADHVGADAATLLGKNFVVEGIKGDGTFTGYAATNVVFDHYNVNYTATLDGDGNITTPTANTTESNTANWEYVGETKHPLSAVTAQTIKYWDYATTQYDYVAFSYGTAADKANTSDPVFSAVSYTNIGKAVSTGTPVYAVLGSAKELAKTYIADLVTVYNRDGVSEFGTTTVTPKFRSLGTKVRVAFYETVPGYAVKNLKFYNAAWDGSTPTSTPGADEATLFAASAIFPSATTAGVMSVYYPTVGFDKRPGGSDENADYNQAHITFTAGTGAQALATTKTFGEIVYTTYTENSQPITDALGKTSNEASYAGDKTAADHAYQIVLPLGTKDNLQIRVEYDLVPTDGGTETIHVRDARAVVPAAYADWKPNYAYTYIFKISDNTNGWTGVDGDDNVVEGLTPITFDAVVADSEDGIQETITTVATPSITTYQKGVNVSSYNEYEAGDIYVSVMNGTTPVTLTDSPANYGVYLVTAGEDKVNEAIAEDMLSGTKTNTGITWTPAIYEAVNEVPAADGNTLSVSAAKFAAASGKTYVFDVIVGGKNYVKVIRVQ